MSKLEDHKLWQMASEVAQDIYSLIELLPEEEKWGMESKLRSRAIDFSTDIADGVGTPDPRETKHSFGHAKKSLFGIKSVLILSLKTGILEVEPELLVRINKISDELDNEIDKATKGISAYIREFSNEYGEEAAK